MFLPDCHLDPDKKNSPYSLSKSFLKEYRPDITVLLGDFSHTESLSRHNQNNRRILEGKRYEDECALLNNELDDISKYSKEIVYIEGNHENWVEQFLDQNPELERILELPKMLKLKERKIEWIPINKLYRIGDLYCVHGFYVGNNHAREHLNRLGCNIIYGHTHNAQTAQMNMKMQKPYMAYGLGCLCDHEPTYMKNRPANWINQFAIADVDTHHGHFNVTPINIIGKSFMIMGKRYSL